MNLISLRLFPHILTTVLLLFCTCVAQPSQETVPKPEFALEVNSGMGQPHEFPVFKGGGAGMSRFKRIISWSPSVREARVNEILFQFDREGDAAVVVISARLENDKEVKIGTYRLSMGETATTEELAKFGVEPLSLRVVEAKPLIKNPVAPLMPILENKTEALAVVSFSKADPPVDSFVLVLRNVSLKNIIGVDLYLPHPSGNGGQGQRARGNKTNPVMLPDAVSSYHISLSSGGWRTSTGFVSEPAFQQTLIIRTVVFDDGTYDGLLEPAAEFAAEHRGLNIQRRRILQLLQEPTNRNLITLDGLKEAAYALSKTSEGSVTNELRIHFPSLGEKAKPWLLRSVESGLREGKQEFLHHINHFEENQKQPGQQISFAEWLKQIRVTYEELISQ